MKKIGLCFVLVLGMVACNQNQTSNSNESIEKDTVEGVAYVNDVKFTRPEFDAMQHSTDSFLKSKDRHVLPHSLAKLWMISDSISNVLLEEGKNYGLMTSEYKKVMPIYAEMHLKHAKLVDGQIVVDLTLEEFIETGLHEAYYHEFMQGYKDMNFFNKIHRATPERINEQWEKRTADYKEILEGSRKDSSEKTPN